MGNEKIVIEKMTTSMMGTISEASVQHQHPLRRPRYCHSSVDALDPSS